MSWHCSVGSKSNLIKVGSLYYLFKGLKRGVAGKLFRMFPGHVEKSRAGKTVLVKELLGSINVVCRDLSFLLEFCENLLEVVGSVVMPHSLEVGLV